MPVLPNIDTVSTVTVTVQENATNPNSPVLLSRHEFTLTGDGDELKASYNGPAANPGTELDIDNFKQFYQTMVGASYSEEIPENESEYAELTGKQPLVQIEYRFDDGKSPQTLSFYPGPVRRAVMSANNGTPYYTTQIYVDRVIADVKKVAAGETVKSYM
jgi:hypothetical protein